MSINSVNISGNLTRDGELKVTQSGTSVLRFGVAVNERRRNQSGEWEDYANFVDCTMWGKRADALAKYLTKGTKVAISGKLHYSSWQAKDGSKRSKIEVIVDELEFMSRQGVSNGVSGNGQPTTPPQPQNAPQGSYSAPQPYSDVDIPF